MMNNQESIIRHSVVVRLNHWLIASSGLLLAFSGIGFMPLYGRFYVNEIPGLSWVTNFQIQMDLHYFSASLFIAACLFHVLYHWRRKEFALVPRKGDVHESWLIIRAMLSKEQEPAHDKFLAEQRIAYAAFVITIVVLFVSGYFLAVKNSLLLFVDPQVLQVIILMHHVVTYFFILLVVLHLAAFFIKANRPLLPTMLHGRVKKGYALKRHLKWIDSNDTLGQREN